MGNGAEERVEEIARGEKSRGRMWNRAEEEWEKEQRKSREKI